MSEHNQSGFQHSQPQLENHETSTVYSDAAKIKPDERETISAFLEILQRQLAICDEEASEAIQSFMSCMNRMLAEGKVDLRSFEKWLGDHGIQADSDEESGRIDPTYVDYAFKQIRQEKPGPKPTRFSKLRKAFKGKENKSILLDDLSIVYVDHANPRAYAQTAIFDANQAFIEQDLQIEIQSISVKSRHTYETRYRLCLVNG